MKLSVIKPPRVFQVGKSINKIILSHVLSILASDNELYTFSSSSFPGNYDITSKSWGLYLTQSINQRLSSENFIVYVIEGIATKKQFLVAVHNSPHHKSLFTQYLIDEDLAVVHEFSSSIA